MLRDLWHTSCSLLSSVLIIAGTFSPTNAGHVRYKNDTILPANGTGSRYAKACNDAWHSYELASSSYIQNYGTIVTKTTTLGGPWTSYFTYYANATTLCDGVARLATSPAISLSTSSSTGFSPYTSTATYTWSQWNGTAAVSPKCSIKPSDCDPLWAAYSRSLTRGNLSMGYQASPITRAPLPMMALPTPLLTPHCANSSARAQQSSADNIITMCGPCTIYGQDVQLVYFPVPTTVSRDMCASTPSASLTYYNTDAVIEAFAGKNYSGKTANTQRAPTAVVGQHTFTSGTAYISIATVWAQDRCRKNFGQASDVILAMPSSSVLSLRYSQNHFQYFFITSKQTGYPVSYADFNTPIPWSAYNGQAICRGPYTGYPCSVIYEGQFFPQLAIPPGIRQLKPEWETCQMWYGGLYDPPMALQPQTDVEKPTTPGSNTKTPASTTPGPTTTTNINGVTRPAIPGSTRVTVPMETTVPQQSGGGKTSETFVVRVLTTITTTKTIRGSMSNVLTIETSVETVSRPDSGGSEGQDPNNDPGDPAVTTDVGGEGGGPVLETISSSITQTTTTTAGFITTSEAGSGAGPATITSKASGRVTISYDLILTYFGGFVYTLMTVI